VLGEKAGLRALAYRCVFAIKSVLQMLQTASNCFRRSCYCFIRFTPVYRVKHEASAEAKIVKKTTDKNKLEIFCRKQ
jgi:hypothetical protein